MRRSGGAAFASAAALSLPLVAAATASAQVEPIRLSYRAHDGCPTEEQFVDRVRMHTFRMGAANGAGPARTFDIGVDAAGKESRGTLRITSASGETSSREVRAGSCDEVISALALVTALAIDPQASLIETAPPRPAVASPPQLTPTAPPSTRPRARRR